MERKFNEESKFCSFSFSRVTFEIKNKLKVEFEFFFMLWLEKFRHSHMNPISTPINDSLTE